MLSLCVLDPAKQPSLSKSCSSHRWERYCFSFQLQTLQLHQKKDSCFHIVPKSYHLVLLWSLLRVTPVWQLPFINAVKYVNKHDIYYYHNILQLHWCSLIQQKQTWAKYIFKMSAHMPMPAKGVTFFVFYFYSFLRTLHTGKSFQGNPAYTGIKWFLLIQLALFAELFQARPEKHSLASTSWMCARAQLQCCHINPQARTSSGSTGGELQPL